MVNGRTSRFTSIHPSQERIRKQIKIVNDVNNNRFIYNNTGFFVYKKDFDYWALTTMLYFFWKAAISSSFFLYVLAICTMTV